MANSKHLEILKQGVDSWNTWRRNNFQIEPILHWANLNGADLTGANLHWANLNGADLREAKLVRTDLSSANLSGADLRKADLAGASLWEANLREADLREANLGGASLRGARLYKANLREASLVNADLSGANLQEADLDGARVGWTLFADNDLSTVKGLETLNHRGPSTVGVDTIHKSGGIIPWVFLRNCGVPDEFITYRRLLVVNPIQFYSCFISYSSKDQPFAERLYADLQSKGVRCWFAPEHLKIGDKIRDRIDESIALRDKLLLILSESSIGSDWVEHEVESALEEERQSERAILFPVRLDEAIFDCKKGWGALIRRTRHIGDFTKWKDHESYQKAFERLLRDLKASREVSLSKFRQ